MTDALYLHDAYLRRFTGHVVAHGDGSTVLLDRTAFYPTGGGQPSDTGSLRTSSGPVWRVGSVEKGPDGVRHILEPTAPPPAVGEEVEGEIDWPLRHRHMRYHTFLHLLSGVVYHRFASGITGGQIHADRARMDFSLPTFSKEVAQELLDEVNRRAAGDLPVSVRFIPRAELERDPALVRVARDLLPDVDPVRLIDIGGFDVQADGGTHVHSTREVGRARIERLENKGARNKRLYVVLEEATAEEAHGP